MSIHVLIVPTEHYVTQGYPLGGIFQHQQALALQRTDVRVGVIGVGVITPRFLFRAYPYPAVEQDAGIPVYRKYVRRLLPQRWVPASRAIPLHQRLGLELFSRYLRQQGRPDVVHAHNIRYASFIADAIREAHDIPFVITEHSSEWMSRADAGVVASLEQVVGRSSGFTAVSRALATEIESRLSISGVGILPNIVDSSFLDSPLVPRAIVPGAARFLSVGLLNANKNHASLIEAFAARFRGTRATLRIGGDGPLRENLERLATRLGVESQVTLLGHLSRAGVLAEMQGANCLVLSSRYETFGVVLIEAMATGIPVIATRAKGPEELVNDGNGILVEPDDPVALGAAMVHMAEHLGDYSPTALREACRANFGPDAFVQRARTLYTRALTVSQVSLRQS